MPTRSPYTIRARSRWSRMVIGVCIRPPGGHQRRAQLGRSVRTEQVNRQPATLRPWLCAPINGYGRFGSSRPAVRPPTPARPGESASTVRSPSPRPKVKVGDVVQPLGATARSSMSPTNCSRSGCRPPGGRCRRGPFAATAEEAGSSRSPRVRPTRPGQRAPDEEGPSGDRQAARRTTQLIRRLSPRRTRRRVGPSRQRG